jgi:hypothetical protein
MAEDLNTLIENVSNMVLATLYGLQVCVCIVMLAQIRRRKEQKKIRRSDHTKGEERSRAERPDATPPCAHRQQRARSVCELSTPLAP